MVACNNVWIILIRKKFPISNKPFPSPKLCQVIEGPSPLQWLGVGFTLWKGSFILTGTILLLLRITKDEYCRTHYEERNTLKNKPPFCDICTEWLFHESLKWCDILRLTRNQIISKLNAKTLKYCFCPTALVLSREEKVPL